MVGLSSIPSPHPKTVGCSQLHPKIWGIQPAFDRNKDTPLSYDIDCILKLEGKGQTSLWASPNSLLHIFEQWNPTYRALV